MNVVSSAKRIVKRMYRRLTDKPIQEKFPQFDIGRGTYGIPKIRSWQEGAHPAHRCVLLHRGERANLPRW